MSVSRPTGLGIPSGSLSGRLVSNSLWNLMAFFFYVGVTFLSLPWFLKCLGKSHYGLLVLLGSLTAPLGLLNLGFGQATIKFVADCMGRRDLEGAGRYVSNTLLFNLCMGVLGAGTLVLLAPLLATRLFQLGPQERPLVEACLHWTALTWIVSQAAATFTAIPAALQRFGVVSLATISFNTGNIILSMAPLLLGHGLLAVVKVRFFWSLAGLAGWICLARRILPQLALRPAFEASAFRNSVGFGVWQTAANAGGLLANQSDKYLLGIYLSAEAVALFNVPYLIFTTLFTVVSKLSESTFPAVSDLHGRGETARALDVLLRAGAWLSLFMVCLQGTVFIFAGDILRLYLGRELAESSAPILRIFALTAVIAAPSIMVNQYLLGIGATPWLAMLALTSGVLTMLMSWWLIPRFGLAGAAWSDLAAIVLSRPLGHWTIWHCLLRPLVAGTRFLRALYGMSLVALPATFGLSWLRQQVGWQPGLLGLLAGLSCTVVAQGALLLLVDRLWNDPFLVLRLPIDMRFPRKRVTVSSTPV